MVGSAVAQEMVTQVLSRFNERYQEKSDAKEHVERLEMAHIKLEAVLDISQRWSVTSAPLLRWRSKLKRAAQECDHTLRRCKQRLQEEEELQQRLRSFSLPKRIAHAARSLVSSISSSRGSDEDDELMGGSTVRRFERFAEGAGEFLRYVELGGTPCRRYMFFDPLVRYLLAGNGTKCCFAHGGQHLSFVLQPFSPPEHGMEGSLVILLEDGYVPENNFMLSLILRLSESTDVVGVVVRCLQLFTIKTKLTQLPTQDLCWVPDAYLCGRIEHQDNFYTASSKWFRPNPLCCQRQDHHYAQGYADGRTSPSEPLPYDDDDDDDVCLEAVTQVSLLGHVALSGWGNRKRAAVVDLPPAVGGASATEMINGEARGLYWNICFQELLDDILLRKAVHYLRGSAAAASYQMRWRSKHGRAYLQAEKASWRRATTRKDVGEKRRRPGKKVQAWTSGIDEFMSSWIAHEPAQLQALAVDWTQKQERLLLKTNPCIQDCPITSLSLQDLRSLARKIKSFSTFVA
ncbi:hypothetical protein BS78_05G189800 [Paspalum vaginatum]|nr:hypothetical protein BS78_05G189800 [Paspalum vaginatum]